jgi:hypothetical protein
MMLKFLVGILFMVTAFHANAEEGTTKHFISLAMKSGNPVSGTLTGDGLKGVQKMTQSSDPVSIRVERVEVYANQRDDSCGKYRVTYSQTGVKDVEGNIHKEPYQFGLDMNLCADGLPPVLEGGGR